MERFRCDWCQKFVEGTPERYARRQFCLNGDCKNKYRRLIDGRSLVVYEATDGLEGGHYDCGLDV